MIKTKFQAYILQMTRILFSASTDPVTKKFAIEGKPLQSRKNFGIAVAMLPGKF